jgi:hypothetical protein
MLAKEGGKRYFCVCPMIDLVEGLPARENYPRTCQIVTLMNLEVRKGEPMEGSTVDQTPLFELCLKICRD